MFPGSDGLVRSVQVRAKGVNIQKANHQDLFTGTVRFWRNSANRKSLKQKRSTMNFP